MVKALDCGIVVNEFEFQSLYVHFRTNTLWKCIISTSYSPSYGLKSFAAVLLKDGFGIKQPTKVDMPLKKEAKP